VAALLNLRYRVSYDGQGAMELEAEAEKHDGRCPENYSYQVEAHDPESLRIDFLPLFTEICADLDDRIGTAAIAYRFHRTVAAAATDVCLRISAATGLDRVVLSGGVFQNRLLSEMIYTAVTKAGLNVFTHRLVPPNDGGIALGQAAIAGRRIC
jgi:hydrogenase maturation protein HypF